MKSFRINRLPTDSVLLQDDLDSHSNWYIINNLLLINIYNVETCKTMTYLNPNFPYYWYGISLPEPVSRVCTTFLSV